MKFDFLFEEGRELDCITLGRANVDCYPPEGDTLDKARVYNVYVGGSPANIAAGMARHDLRTGIITRVAKDRHGEFVVHYLSSVFGVDVSQVQYDESGAKTSLAFAECRKDADVIMYRNNVADLQLNADEIDKGYIASAKSIFVSGTALTEQPSRDAIMTALNYAKETGTVCAMDIDYRPYGWKSLEEASEIITRAAAMSQILIGTREEFEVAGGAGNISSDISDEACAQYFLERGAMLVVIKRGGDGSMCMYKDGGQVRHVAGTVYPVDYKKPYGAGDAFASSLLSFLIKGQDLAYAMRGAAAAASINISGDSCTEAMPTEQEIEDFIRTYDKK